MSHKYFIIVFSALFLFLGLSTAQAVIGEDDAYVYYTYQIEDGSLWGGEVWERFMDGDGITAVSSLSDPSTNYAVSEIRRSSVDFIKGACAEASFSNAAYPETVSGGYGVSIADAYVEITKTFEVQQAGQASVAFSLEGSLSASGMLSEADYALEVWDEYEGYILNADYVDDSVQNGIMQVNESLQFFYNFGEDDIDHSFNVTLALYIRVVAGNEFFDAQSENGDFEGVVDGYAEANFLETLSFDSITGGIVAVGDEIPPSVPVPASGILLISGLLGLASCTRKRAV
nr:hypothetical protein [uncultured Desulfobacter sp.]